MSWAKYLEDDIKIMTDRLYMKNQGQTEPIKAPKGIIDSPCRIHPTVGRAGIRTDTATGQR